jgi:hypothetical protein
MVMGNRKVVFLTKGRQGVKMNESYDYFRLPNNKGIEKVMPQLDGSFSE